MKICGEDFPKRGSKLVELERGNLSLTVLLTATPLGYNEKILDWIRTTLPPTRYATSLRGKVLKDRDGRHVKEEVSDDPVYLRKTRRASVLMAVALLYEGLKEDPNISWETPEPPNGVEMESFFEKIHEEMKEANFTTAELQFLCNEVAQLSIQKDADLKEERQSF